jgi:hypothetical protein
MRRGYDREVASWLTHGRRAVVLVALAAFASTGRQAGAAETATILVRLAVDPAPAGLDWAYSGVGERFRLGTSATERRLEPSAGTYTLVENGTRSGQPKTLTRVTCSDPTADTTTNLALASATINAAAGETVTCTFTHRALGLRPAAAALAFARLYAPIVRLSSGEPYRPLRIENYLGTSVLRTGAPPNGTVRDARPTAFTVPLAPAASYLDVRGAEPSRGAAAYPQIEQRAQAASPRPMLYWHLVRDASNDRVAVEYWLLYLYNAAFDRHEADWEGVTVFIAGGAPAGLSYSQHQGRQWVSWTAQTKVATHPVVYVARGSHANYPRSGRFRVRACWTVRVRRCAPTTKEDVADGAGAKLATEVYDLHELGGVPYRGGWGSGSYVVAVGLTRDRVTDPRVRADYTNPFRAVPR